MRSIAWKVVVALGFSAAMMSAHADSVAINEVAYQSPTRVSYDVVNSSNTPISIFAITNNDDMGDYALSTRAGWSGYRVTREKWDNVADNGPAGLHFGAAGQTPEQSQNDPMKYFGGPAENTDVLGALALGAFADLFGADNTDKYVHVYWIRFDDGAAIAPGESAVNQFWFYEGAAASVGAAWGVEGTAGNEQLVLIAKLIQPNADNNVPEPASLALLGIALAGLGFSRRRQA